MTDRLADLSRLPCKCVPSMAESFDYASPLSIDTVTELDTDECVRPAHGMTGSRFEFTIDPSNPYFVSLSSMTLTVKCKVVDGDGKDLDEDSNQPGFVNNIIASMWTNIEYKIHDTEINNRTFPHPGYKSVISSLLSYNPQGAKHLKAGGFAVENGLTNASTAATNGNFAGWTTKLKESGIVQLTGPLPIDLCAMDNFLAPGTKLEIILVPASPDFFLMCSSSTAKFKVKFSDMFLEYRRVRLPPLHANRIIDSGMHGGHRYIGPFTHITTHEVPKGSSLAVVPLYPNGHPRPKHLIIGQVPSTNFFGTISTNPYVFKHYKLNHLALRFNHVIYTNTELSPDFEKNLYAREYNRLFTQTGKRGSTSQGILISEANFTANHTLFPFDLTPDECNSRHLHLGHPTRLDVEMQWAEPLPEAVIVLTMATFDQVMHVDNRTGNVKISLI